MDISGVSKVSESGETFDSEARCQRCPAFADGNSRIAFGKEMPDGEIVIAIVTWALCKTCHQELKALERNADLLKQLVSV